MNTQLYRIRIEVKNDDGTFEDVAVMERNLPQGVGGEILKAAMTACETIEEREGLPGPEGGMSQ